MNEMQIFENEEFGKIRTLTINDEPWFVGKDVAGVLGYEKARNAIAAHVDRDDALKQGIIDSLGRRQEMIIINESGLYALILSSKLPSAKRFKHWVTSEVLPALRKAGKYEMPRNKQYQPTRPLTTDDYEDAARTISKCHNSRLPIVIDLYRKAGLDIDEIPEMRKQSHSDGSSKRELVDILNRYSMKDLCERLPICKSSIYYYRTGKYTPRQERREEIIKILEGDP